MERILTRWLDIPDLRKLDVYLANNGYKAARKAFFEMSTDDIINEVKNSNLRGRGGAAFPTGVKWSFIPKDSKKPVYVCVNGDESEPGTFANRYEFENDPHGIIEGILIACRAVGSHTAYIYMRGEFTVQKRSMDAALAEARAAGYVGKDVMGSGYGVDIWTHKGAGAYICGEESALLESLEGKRGYPRNRPPFPAIVGAFGCPTVVNNIETLSNVPHIINRGAAWYKAIGPEKSPGTKLVCLSGHVNKPGLYELPMGTPMKDIIYDVGGGILGGKTLKGVIPGGSSFPVLNKEEAERAIFDFDSMRTIGSAMGSGVRHRHGRRYLHDRYAAGDRALLSSRIVRTVHAVPRRMRLDRKNHDRDGSGAGQDRAARAAQQHLRQHGRQYDLRARRQYRDAGQELRHQVSRRIRSAHQARALSVQDRVRAAGRVT